MRVLSPLQTGVLQKPFSYNGRHFLCVSLLWGFRLETGEVVLEADLWSALGDLLKEGRVFDQGMPKARGEFLCAGSFHAPDGEAVAQAAVAVSVGGYEKKLVVTGPRYWRRGVATRPEPIVSLPIRYDQAFGGEGFPDNPIGKGYAAQEHTEANSETVALPCVEYPREAVSSPSQTPRPASLEGRDMGWRPRQQYAGTYDDEYMRTRMPGLPDDVDWRLFNDAAEDQWIEGFFRGDEPFSLQNVHPDQPFLRGRLPGVHGRAFIDRRLDPHRKNSELEFREIPLRLDTVWFLPSEGIGVVIHRGTTEIAEDDGTDVVHLLAAHENLSDPTRSLEHYREEMRKRADPEEGYRYLLDTRALLPLGCSCAIQDLMANNDMEMENLGQQNAQAYGERQREKAQAQAEEQLDSIQAKLDEQRERAPEATGQAEQELETTRAAIQGGHQPSEQEQELQRLMEKIAPGASSGQLDIANVDFKAIDELSDYMNRMAAEQRAQAEEMARERIEEMRRQNVPEQAEITKAIEEAERALAAVNEPAPLPRPKFDIDFDQVEEQIAALDQYSEELRQAGVDEEQIRAAIPDLGPVREQIAEAEKSIAEQYREGAHYLDESRSPHPGEEAQRRNKLLELAKEGASAAGGDYAFIDLAGVTLRDVDLSTAYLEYVNFAGATLIGVKLVGAILAKAQLRNCRFEGVDLTNANVGATTIEGSTFVDCKFDEARLGRATIRDTRFERCSLTDRQEMFLETAFERAAFVECEMPTTNFLERDLTRCSFRGTNLTQSNFLQCDLAHADFAYATLSSTNIVSTPAPGTRFDHGLLDNVRFIDEPVLNDCSFVKADLRGANLRDADLAGAVFSGAVLDQADFSESDLADARLDRVSAIGSQFRKCNLERANLYGTDLREASLMKARLLRTSFTAGNLYSVSFLYATLGETDFQGANLDNTILQDWRPSSG